MQARILTRSYQKAQTFGVLLLAFVLTNCSFNKSFLQPTKIPVSAKKARFAIGADTTVVFFTGATHQPTFTRRGRDTLDLGYTIESVLFKSASGNMLNGWLLRPRNAPPAITLLHLHGNGGCLLSQYGAIAPLAKAGFQVFMFDYSGYGFSAGDATRENVLADALSALDYLKARPEVAHTKLVIYGQSLGGHLSAVVAAQRSSDIDGLVIEGAFSSHKDIAAQQVPVIGRLLVKQGYCATTAIKDFHKPVLVIHSTEDKEVPFFMGKKIFARANEPKEFYEVKKCHICAPEYYTDEISGKIKNMLSAK